MPIRIFHCVPCDQAIPEPDLQTGDRCPRCWAPVERMVDVLWREGQARRREAAWQHQAWEAQQAEATTALDRHRRLAQGTLERLRVAARVHDRRAADDRERQHLQALVQRRLEEAR